MKNHFKQYSWDGYEDLLDRTRVILGTKSGLLHDLYSLCIHYGFYIFSMAFKHCSGRAE